MDSSDLRAAVEAKLRLEHVKLARLIAERRSEEEALSDEAWWARRVGSVERLGIGFAEALAQEKDAALERRRREREAPPYDMEGKLRSEVERLMPYIVGVRTEWDETGPLTERQYSKAALLLGLSNIGALTERITENAKQATDPRKKAILGQLANNSRQDLKDLEQLAEDPVTEEKLSEISARVVARIQALAKRTISKSDPPANARSSGLTA